MSINALKYTSRENGESSNKTTIPVALKPEILFDRTDTVLMLREWKPRWFAERAVLGLISGIFFDMVVQVHTVKVAWFVNTVFQKSTVAILFANSKP